MFDATALASNANAKTFDGGHSELLLVSQDSDDVDLDIQSCCLFLKIRQECLMEGMLLKQGAKRSDAFQARWITLSGVKLTYAPSKTAHTLGEVPMSEVVGLAVADAPHGAEDAGIVKQLLWRKRCADLDADYRRAQDYSVGQVPVPFPQNVLVDVLDELRQVAGCSGEIETTDMADVTCAATQGEFALFTSTIGFCRGRVYVFKQEEWHLRQEWVAMVSFYDS